MQSQKSHSSKLFLLKNIFVVSAGFLISFFSLNFNTNEASALFTPTLSASVDQTASSVNGNQVINSTNKTTEIPLNLTVNTNNKTGYTATLNSETDETALVNTDSTTNAKINSISSAELLGSFSNNTWGVKVGGNTNFSPIPKLTAPMNVMQTTGKTNDDESNQLSIGMKLSDNLESGRYTNKLIFSILTNNYEHIAIMTEGPDFNTKLKALETATDKIEHFKKSTAAPAVSMNAVNIEDEDSDYEIKLWLDPTDKTAYYYAEVEKVYLNEDSSKMFYSSYYEQKIRNVFDIDPSNFDTSNVINMSGMFFNMRNLTSLDLSNFNTSKVANMSGMFASMRNLTTFNLSNFNTSKVVNMSTMFMDTYNLTSLNLSNFNTSNVTNMSSMFAGMYNLTTLNLSNFNTSKVTNMERMFADISNLSTFDLSNFDTSNVTNMGSMFSNMHNLTSLDISNFDTSQVTNMKDMFSLFNEYIPNDKLERIYVNNDFNTSKLTNFPNMFKNRKKLRGGNGSYLADPSTADKTWLRVDRPGVQGYFTKKS